VSKTSDELAQERTDLALRRTVMAMDRTLMSWVRTGLSIISFGFTIYRILAALQERGATLRADDTPRQVGMFMVAAGTLALVLGVIEFLTTVRQLRREGKVNYLRSSSGIAVAIALFGVFVFFGIRNQAF
jgi:putative membrane protein